MIITTKDRRRTLVRQLGAVLGQECPVDFEVVVSDDGSTDGTATMLAEWAGVEPRLRVTRAETSGGGSAARNRGLHQARGDLVAYCDDDDIVEPGWLAALVRSAGTADIVAGRYLPCVETSDGRLRLLHKDKNDEKVGEDGVVPPFLGFLPHAPGGCMAVWRTVASAVGGWNPAYLRGVDVEFSWRSQVAGYRLAVTPDACIRYRQRATLIATVRQHFRWGVVDARLVAAFRARGCPQAPVADVLHGVAGIMVHSWRLVADPRRRRGYLALAAHRVGRLVGSAQYRVRCI